MNVNVVLRAKIEFFIVVVDSAWTLNSRRFAELVTIVELTCQEDRCLQQHLVIVGEIWTNSRPSLCAVYRKTENRHYD